MHTESFPPIVYDCQSVLTEYFDQNWFVIKHLPDTCLLPIPTGTIGDLAGNQIAETSIPHAPHQQSVNTEDLNLLIQIGRET